MRRIFVIGMSTMLLGSMTAIAVAEEPSADDNTEVESQLSEAQMRKAQLIADYFTPEDATEDEVVSVESIIELRTGEPSVGWGAIYQLMLLSEAGVEVDPDGDGWGFGKYFKELRDEDPDWLGEHPKNLGQLKKQQRAEEKAEAKANRGKGKKNSG